MYLMRDLNRWNLGKLALVLLVLCLQVTPAYAAREALVADVQGDVFVRIQEDKWQPALPGMSLNEKDELRTGGDGYAEVLMDGGDVARLEIKKNSYFKIHTLGTDPKTGDKETLLDLAIGGVLVHAEKLQGDSKFEVRTPTSTTGVRGTIFEVNVDDVAAPGA